MSDRFILAAATDILGDTEFLLVDGQLAYNRPDTQDVTRLLMVPDAIRGEILALAAQLDAAAQEPPYRLYKSVFISRLTSDEAEAMEAVLAAADAKLRLLFNSVEYFVSDDPLFGTLNATVSAALGAGRAAELLAAQ